MRFTVIVPIFNAEMYVRQCLESLLTQSFRDFEVIMVDDGSIDNSVKICNEYCARDNRFRLESHERNRGASAARNTGIANALGDYLLFLDNDDWWDSDSALKDVDSALRAWGDPDVLCYPLGEYRKGDPAPRKETYRLEGNINAKSSYRSAALAIVQQGLYYSSASSKTVKRAVVESNSLKFDEEFRHNEDSEWSRRLLLIASSIGWLDTSFYVYRRNSDVSQSSHPDYRNVLDSLLSIIERQIRDNDNKAYDRAHCELASAFVAYIYVLALSYAGILREDIGSDSFEFLKQSRWLLRYPAQKRVAYVRWCMRVVGIRVTSRLLGFVMRREQQRITKSK